MSLAVLDESLLIRPAVDLVSDRFQFFADAALYGFARLLFKLKIERERLFNRGALTAGWRMRSTLIKGMHWLSLGWDLKCLDKELDYTPV
jgi:hypothetical protein